MTNYEKFKNEIEELEIDCCDQIAVLKQRESPSAVAASNADIGKGCAKLLLKWAATEAKGEM